MRYLNYGAELALEDKYGKSVWSQSQGPWEKADRLLRKRRNPIKVSVIALGTVVFGTVSLLIILGVLSNVIERF